MHLRQKIGFVLCALFWQLSAAAGTSADALAALLDAGRSAEFLTTAKQLAKKGDADALFLLGKAYEQGTIVQFDWGLAWDYYDQAAEKGSARAENALGMLRLNIYDDAKGALFHFQRALALGLKVPTEENIRQAYKLGCNQEGLFPEPCSAAGDAFLQTWRTEEKNAFLDDAVNAYSKACLLARHHMSAAKVEHVCGLAIQWSEKGAALGLARATFNRGAIEYDEHNYNAALPWYRLAYERQLGLAAFQLGWMQETGEGMPADPAAAREWYKRGAKLNDQRSIEILQMYWRREINASFDPEQIKAVANEWRQFLPPSQPPEGATLRLQVIDTLANNLQHFPSLANDAVPTRFCPPDPDGWSRDPYSKWRIYSVMTPEETTMAGDIPLIGEGSYVKGCLNLSKDIRRKLQTALAQGATPMLRSVAHYNLLAIEATPSGALILGLGLPLSY